MDNSTLGAHIPRRDSTDTAGMRSALILDGDISLDGFSDQIQDKDDLLSLQPGQQSVVQLVYCLILEMKGL